jgi:hypothetical protein
MGSDHYRYPVRKEDSWHSQLGEQCKPDMAWNASAAVSGNTKASPARGQRKANYNTPKLYLQ